MGSWQWPWSKKEQVQGPRSVNIFLGFFFVVNYCLSTGFLGIPYAFFYAGYLAAIPTLLVVAFVTWNGASWEVEVMARAQALERYRSQETSNNKNVSSDNDSNKLISQESIENTQMDNNHPNFNISLDRKFEIGELCEIFFNRWMKYLYVVSVILASFVACWSYSTIAGSAWASNIPLNFGTLHQCGPEAFHHRLLPTGTPELDSCRNAYYFSLFLFSLIVIPLSVLELKEQAIFQMCFGVLRFATVAIIIIYCIVKLIEGGDNCELLQSNETWVNTSHTSPNSTFSSVPMNMVFKFDLKGWFLATAVFTYAFIVHQGIPSLTHPIKQKQYLHWLIVFVFGSMGLCYLALGIIAPLWFRVTVQETITLNWAKFSRPNNTVALRVLSYYLVLFPSVDVCFTFALAVQTMANNIYSLITGQDTSKKPNHRCNWLFNLLLRAFVAVLPILAAFGIANLVYIIKYSGILAFAAIILPAGLQFQSIRVCKTTFLPLLATGKKNFPMSKLEQNTPETSDSDREVSKGMEKSPLMSNQDCKAALYMTPYSNRVFSHPVAVVITGILGTILYLLIISSFVCHPEKLTCSSYL